MSIFKKHAMAIVAMAIAATNVALMSFGVNDSNDTTNVKAGQQDMYWYSQQGTNNWVLESATPTPLPAENCREIAGERCVKGYPELQEEHEIVDNTFAPVEYFRD